jgi:dipeptidyl aminopeptidase/acylaminoacyl peptidase
MARWPTCCCATLRPAAIALLSVCASTIASAQYDLGPVRIPRTVPPGMARPITANDLVSLRDVGGVERPLALSPDGERVAFQVRQADTSANGYRSSWFVTETRSGQHLVEVGRGGEPRWAHVGSWIVLPAAWSPDSRFLVYAALGADGLQLWRASRDGALREQITHEPADVRMYAWSRDGRRIYFVIGRSRASRAELARRRAADGVLLDTSVYSPEGDPRVDAPWWQRIGDPGFDEHLFEESPTTKVYDVSARCARRATASEAREASERLPPTVTPQQDEANIFDLPRSPDGTMVAYIADPYKGTEKEELYRAVYTKTVGQPPTQRGPVFTAAGSWGQVWWASGGRELILLRSRGHAEDGTVIEAISMVAGSVDTVFQSPDVLTQCSVSATGGQAACIREAPTIPPEVAFLDVTQRTLQTLTRLNPEFQHIQLAPTKRVAWVNRYGDSAYAHLVLPLGYVPGRRYPLVVTTAWSWGFLRDENGEYPIQLFAAHGFAVLDFTEPRLHLGDWSSQAQQKSFDDIALTWWSPLASLEAILDSLTASGLVDSARIGITGLSAGARIVVFGISHSRRFRAAIASGNDDSDPLTWYLAYNQRRWHTALVRQYGLDSPDGPHSRQVSPALNADRIQTPLLINAAGSEYLTTLQLHAELRERRKPIEVWIYPNELHLKWQPQHRLRIYQRNVDWMNFWLRDLEDADPGKREQYARWRQLHDEWVASCGSTPCGK